MGFYSSASAVFGVHVPEEVVDIPKDESFYEWAENLDLPAGYTFSLGTNLSDSDQGNVGIVIHKPDHKIDIMSDKGYTAPWGVTPIPDPEDMEDEEWDEVWYQFILGLGLDFTANYPRWYIVCMGG